MIVFVLCLVYNINMAKEKDFDFLGGALEYEEKRKESMNELVLGSWRELLLRVQSLLFYLKIIFAML